MEEWKWKVVSNTKFSPFGPTKIFLSPFSSYWLTLRFMFVHKCRAFVLPVCSKMVFWQSNFYLRKDRIKHTNIYFFFIDKSRWATSLYLLWTTWTFFKEERPKLWMFLEFMSLFLLWSQLKLSQKLEEQNQELDVHVHGVSYF